MKNKAQGKRKIRMQAGAIRTKANRKWAVILVRNVVCIAIPVFAWNVYFIPAVGVDKK